MPQQSASSGGGMTMNSNNYIVVLIILVILLAFSIGNITTISVVKVDTINKNLFEYYLYYINHQNKA